MGHLLSPAALEPLTSPQDGGVLKPLDVGITAKHCVPRRGRGGEGRGGEAWEDSRATQCDAKGAAIDAYASQGVGEFARSLDGRARSA